MKDNITIVILFAVFFAMSFGLTSSCRNYRIEACEEKGGTAVVPPWFSNDPGGVSCIEPK